MKFFFNPSNGAVFCICTVTSKLYFSHSCDKTHCFTKWMQLKRLWADNEYVDNELEICRFILKYYTQAVSTNSTICNFYFFVTLENGQSRSGCIEKGIGWKTNGYTDWSCSNRRFHTARQLDQAPATKSMDIMVLRCGKKQIMGSMPAPNYQFWYSRRLLESI